MIFRNTLHSRRLRHTGVVALVTFFVAACQQHEQPQSTSRETAIDWARAALERNPNLELIATDTNTQVFTVRDKQTGEVRAIKLDELAAAPVTSLAPRSTAPAQLAAPEQAPANTAETPASQQPARTAQRAAPTEPTESPPQSASASAEQSPDASEYKIERSDGQVRVSGPGVSIVSSGAGTSDATTGAQQNAVEPIICEGQRMVHLDSRQIYVEGDAITVRGGCEMHITNSRIVATGTGIVVEDGTVHVSNSHIEGVENSFNADSRAKVFVRASTFRGLPRRSEMALVQDQGGNRWR